MPWPELWARWRRLQRRATQGNGNPDARYEQAVQRTTAEALKLKPRRGSHG